MSLARAIATVGGLTMLSRLAGFARDILTAGILGAGPANDAFVVALKLPNLFRRLFAEGAFHVSFVPMFSGIVQSDGQKEALRFAEEALAVLLLALVPLTIAAMIFMPYLIPVIAPGFGDDPARFNMAVDLSRVTFPYLTLISLVALMGGMLNALGRFGPFAEGPILFNACLIMALLLAWIFPSHVSAAPALAWSVTIAGVCQLIWLRRALKKEGIPLRLIRPSFTPRIRRLLKLMAPGALGAGALQINVLIDIVFASFLPTGAISYLYYADRLHQLPLGVIGVAIGTTLLPMLSRHVKSGQKDFVAQSTNRAIEFGLMLTFPAAVAFCVIPEPIITALFQRGTFQAADAAATAMALAAYSLGIPAYVLVKVLATSFFAREDTTAPVKVAVSVAVLNTVLAALLIIPLKHVGLALATSLAGWIQVALLGWKLHKRDHLNLDLRLRQRAPRIFLSGIIMGGSLWGGEYLLRDYLTAGFWTRGLALGALIGFGCIVYGVIGQISGAFNVREMVALLKKSGAGSIASSETSTT